MSTINLPAVVDIESRDSALDKDTKILNGYVEVVNKEKTLLLKRPGMDEVLTMASPAAPQLMVKYLNMLFFVMDSNLYYNNQTHALGDSAVCDSVSSYAGSNGGIIDTSTYAVTTYAPWAATTTYTAGQFIVYGLYVYWSLVDDNTGNDPSDDAFWHQVTPDEMVGTTWNPATSYADGATTTFNNVSVWSTSAGNQAHMPDPTQSTDYWSLLAPLTVTANDLSFAYTGVPYSGGNGVTYIGFLDGDDSGDLGGALAYGGTAQGATEVGTYTIIPSGYTSSKYEFNYITGTLTISSASTYATWNPADSSVELTFTNGNLSISDINDHGQSARATIGKSSGKWYWEITIHEGGGCVGVGNTSATISTNAFGIDANGWEYIDQTSQSGILHNGIVTAPWGTPFTNGDIVSVLFNMDDGQIIFYKNGVSLGLAFSNLTGTLYPMFGTVNGGAFIVATANFGASSFVYSVPEGYNAGLYTE